MPREALEPGAFPSKEKVKPIKGADGVWRITDVRHRTMSGTYVRTSAQGYTSKECSAQFERRWDANRHKGTVRRRSADSAPQFSLTDKLSALFAHFDDLQKAKAEAGKIKWYSYDTYHRAIYPLPGPHAKDDAIKLDVELGSYGIGEMGRAAELHSYLCDIADLSPATAVRHHMILRSAYKIVTLQGLFEVSPMREVPIPDATPAKAARALDEGERYGMVAMLSRAEDWIAGHCYVLAFGLTLLGTGLRPGEGLAVRWVDIPNLDDPDVECAVLRVEATMVRRRGMAVERQQGRKTGEKSNYWITLPRWLTRELRAWKRICKPQSDLDFLFTLEDGSLLTVNRTLGALAKLRAETSMEWFTWGNLRDTVATEVAGRSGEVRAASAQLGHSQGSTVAGTKYVDPKGFVHVTVDNSKWLEFLYPAESDTKVTILEQVHGYAAA